MNNNEFLRTFRRLLAPLDTTTRDNIVREIESLTLDTDDTDDTEATLQQRFGQPQELAAQYLDGVEAAPSVAHRAGKFGRGLMLGLGCLTFAAIVAGVVAWWHFDRDEFDYADEAAPELNQTAPGWTDMDVSAQTAQVSINADQARVVVYWHEHSLLRWKCENGDGVDRTDSGLEIRHGSCLVYMPPVASTVSARQGLVVLVRPQSDVEVSLRQAQLKLAENGDSYQYDIENEDSEIAQFTSVDSAATTIRIDAVQSSVAPYSF